MTTEIVVSIPQFIATLDISIPAGLLESLESASRAVTALDLAHGSDLAALSSLLMRTETVASSKIEHIEASIHDYARALHGSKANTSAVAMASATEATRLLMLAADSGAVTLPDLLLAHKVLMASDALDAKYAGQLRSVQNWVGGSDYSPRGAELVPPPPEHVAALMADLVTFINRDDLPALVQASIAHAQFETIHPFTDGNGRIGRALVNAILRMRRATSKVVIPVASALAAHRASYFQDLERYRSGDAQPIVERFAHACAVAATEAMQTARQLQALGGNWHGLLGRTRSGSAHIRLMQHLMSQPIITASEVEQVLGVKTNVAYLAIDRLLAVGILSPLTDRKRNQVWAATDLLDELTDLDQRIQERSRLLGP
jgi:Fic family protein